MSLITLTLTEQHLKLLKFFKCNLINGNIVLSIDADDGEPVTLTDDNKYEYIDLILNGMPDDFDPFNTEDIKVYSDEQKAEWDKLYSELPMSLEIVLFNGHFELNTYATQYHSRAWRVMK